MKPTYTWAGWLLSLVLIFSLTLCNFLVARALQGSNSRSARPPDDKKESKKTPTIPTWPKVSYDAVRLQDMGSTGKSHHRVIITPVIFLIVGSCLSRMKQKRMPPFTLHKCVKQCEKLRNEWEMRSNNHGFNRVSLALSA